MPAVEDKDIQKSVIGATINLGKKGMAACLSVGVEEAWFTGLNCQIWSVMLQMFSSGSYIDLLTVGERLKGVVRPLYLEECYEFAISPSAIENYATMLKYQYMFQKGAQLARANLQKFETARWDDVEDAVGSIQKSWNQFRLPSAGSEDIVEIGKKQIDRWRSPDKDKGTIYWPLPELAKVLPPLTDELIVICAKESVGKTAIVLQWLNQLADLGTICSLNSLESKKARIWPRLVAHRKQMNMRPLTRGEADDLRYDAAREALEEIGKLPLRISDVGMTTDQIPAWAQAEESAGSKFLVIDNMRHIRPASKSKSLPEQYQAISLCVKWLRDDTGLPTCLLHHLSEDKHGNLDTAWGKDVRKDADILIFLTENTDLSVPATEENGWRGVTMIDFELRKDRDGLRNVCVQLAFRPDVQTFEGYRDYDPPDEMK